MRRRLLTLVAVVLLTLATTASAGAVPRGYWTADPGPDPRRCGVWEQNGSPYFELYNCTWVVPEKTL